MNDLDTTKTSLYKLANGLMSLSYIAFFAWVLLELYSMIF